MLSKTASIVHCLFVFGLFWSLPTHVAARDILLVDDLQAGFGPVAGLLAAEGHVVTELTGERSAGYSHLSDTAFLSGFDMVVVANRHFFGDVPPPAANLAMETYINNGGDLLLTGFSSRSEITDRTLPDLARAIGPETYFSSLPTNQVVNNVDNYITNGPHGDFRGATIANSSFVDQLFANTGLGTVPLVHGAAGQPDKIIFTDLPGGGGSVGVWQGANFSSSTAAQPDFFDGGTFQGMLLNWAEGGTTTQTEVTPRVFSTASHPVDSMVSIDLYVGDPNNGGEFAGSLTPITIEGTMDIVAELDGFGNGTVAITNSSIGAVNADNLLIDFGFLGTASVDVASLDIYVANQTTEVSANSFDLNASPYFAAGFTEVEVDFLSATGALDTILDGLLPGSLGLSNPYYGGTEDFANSVFDGTIDEDVGFFTNQSELNLAIEDVALYLFEFDGLGEIYGVIDGEFHVAFVPEPSGMILGAISAVGFLVLRRQRRATT